MHTVMSVIGFGLLTAALLSIGAVGFSLQFGVTNVLNLAFGAIMTSAIYIHYTTTNASIPIWIGVALAAVFGAVVSLIFSLLVVDPYVRRGTSLVGMAMVTIAVGLVVQFSLEAIQGPTVLSFQAQSQHQLHFLTITMSIRQVVIIALAAALMLAVHLLLKHSRLGLAMRATAADPTLTRACGASTRRIRSVAWMLSGALCAVCGSLLGLNQGAFNSTTGNEFFIVIVAAAIVGGIGKPYGAMLGALIIGLVTEASATVISPSYKDVVAFAVLVIVLLVRPQGLISEYSSARELTQ